ncbi:PREDICTED: RING-H2 finger protein ATL32-like [Camelina sativa]|uniref:RING-type E3 ubiquitin transferase n=1 Tax=Camelina sativa TaxID=90675 RepID=A0ABM0UUJ3_CAMSA|nr:PREDICTED: RING-H2 finger protein ATL32-like [Camelina sativa]
MIRVDSFSPHRWIIFHVAFILQSKANAQSFSPSPPELQQPGQTPSKTTVFAVLVTLFFFIGLLSVYIRHCTRPNSEYSTRYSRRRANDGYSRRGGLDDAVVESFPVFAYSSVKESKLGSNDLECAICLNELEDRETVRLLPICNHLFHIDCIDAWLHSHATCPVCRYNLTAAKSDNSGGAVILRDHVVIDVETVETTKSHHLVGKFPRSNSTGHSMGRLGYGAERFTLRLPDDVMRRIMEVKGRRLKRTRSFDVDLTAEGREKYDRRSGEESSYTVGSGGMLDRWGLTLFVSKSNSGSVRSQKSNGEPLK